MASGLDVLVALIAAVILSGGVVGYFLSVARLNGLSLTSALPKEPGVPRMARVGRGAVLANRRARAISGIFLNS